MQPASQAPQKNRYTPGKGQLAQLISGPFLGLVCWALLRRWPIIRAGWLTLLVVGLFLHRVEGVLGLLVLGHLREAFTEACASRRKDYGRPTDGAFSQEMYG